MNIKKLRVSIIGCGWLGKPLYKTLCKNYQVSCFTRKQEEANLDNYHYNPSKESLFWNCDYAIIAISTKDNYLKTLNQIALHVSANTTVILMSSISVYREYDGKVDENSSITQTTMQVEAEELMQSLREKLIVLRLGGLMADDRISGKWSRVTVFTDGPVNYVHRDDVIGVVEAILSQRVEQGLFNVVAPKHPLRFIIHHHNSKKFGFELCEFKGMTHRIVSSIKLDKYLKYSFQYPDPLKFW